MTESQARIALKQMLCDAAQIYMIVPAKLKTSKRKGGDK